MSRSKRIRTAVLLALVGLPAIGHATYDQQYILSQDTVFQAQIAVAMVQQCDFVMLSQANTVAGHAVEAAFCLQVMQNVPKFVPFVSIVVAGQGSSPMTPLTTPSTVADSLILTAMGVQWPAISGYFTTAPQ
jgi:hypothetical protein